MPNDKYWKERMEALEDMNHKKGRAYTANVEKQFRMAQKNIEDKINYWYARIADNNEITMQGAKRLLRADELEDFKMSVEEYIKKGESLNYSDTWKKQLENASAKVHINRLEALKMQMQQECEVLYGNMADGLDDTLRSMYTSSYYHTAYEMMKGHGVGWAFNRLDDRRIEKAINTVWTNDGKKFSDRVWANKNKLVQELNTVLTQNIIRGESPQRAIEQLSKRMNVSRSRAGTLIMTESAFIHSQSQKDCYTELDVEKLQFVATLDNSTSDICRAMDGVIIAMTDYKIGLNVPPLHPRCRSCMIPYYEDNVGMRAARGEDGKTYLVPSDMTYKDWKKSFVDGETKELQEIGNSSKIDDIVKGLPKIESIKTDADKKAFAEQLIDSMGIDRTDIDVKVKKMADFGACMFRPSTSNGKANYFEYALRKNDSRDMTYQIKTAFHEGYHLALQGREWDLLDHRAIWSDIEETFAESAAHYAAKVYGITDLSPSYSGKLIRVLPRLKKLPEFADCTNITDFGKIAWNERLSGKGGVWKELYDKAFAEKFDKTYYKQYFQYIKDNKETLLDKALENMPDNIPYRKQMLGDLDGALEHIKDTGNIDALKGNEKLVFETVLINAMNKKGI